MYHQFEIEMGNQIRKLRLQRCLTQDMLCAKLQVYGCDLSRSVLGKIEIGQRHLYAWEIKAFKDVFGVSYDDLFV